MIDKIDLFPIKQSVYFIIHQVYNSETPVVCRGIISNIEYDLHIPKYEVIVKKVYSSNEIVKKAFESIRKRNRITKKFSKQNFVDLVSYNYYNVENLKDFINNEIETSKNDFRIVIDHQHISRDKDDVEESVDSFLSMIIEEKLKDLFFMCNIPDYNGLYKVNPTQKKTFIKNIGDAFESVAFRKPEKDYDFKYSSWFFSMLNTFNKKIKNII